MPWLTLLLLGVSGSSLGEETLPWPTGWNRFGDPEFSIGVIELEGRHGRALLIRSDTTDSERFGAIGQTIDAQSYRGRRIQLAGLVRTDQAESGAGLWMRVDQSGDAGEREVLAFDNMADRAVRGDTTWARYTVVLDIPEAADTITFGALLRGAGSAWIDELSLDEASQNTAATDMPVPEALKADS